MLVGEVGTGHGGELRDYSRFGISEPMVLADISPYPPFISFSFWIHFLLEHCSVLEKSGVFLEWDGRSC